MSLLGNYLSRRMEAAFETGVQFIADGIRTYRPDEATPSHLSVLDIGVGGGQIARKVRGYAGRGYHLTGVDIGKVDSIQPCDKYVSSNLENGLPFDNAIFDVIYSNQVIEHLILKSKFLSECKRVLKPGGRFIVTTENIASLDNILSLMLGQEPLVQHTSEKFHSNTFLSPHFMQPYPADEQSDEISHMGHKNVMSFFGLRRLIEFEGMVVEKSLGAGHVAPLMDHWLKFQCRVIGFWSSYN
jgi:ubiquinone/menaquinone biosynthesis C-methylase UbiE